MKIDQIIRTNRKTIAIVVRADGRVIVRAPLRTADAHISAFVAEKQSWIESKLAQVLLNQKRARPRLFTTGESLPYLGRLVPLDLVDKARPALRYTGEKFLLAGPAQNHALRLFTNWYQDQARLIFEERVHLYAQSFQLSYTRLRITSARTRWGSCSTRGTLSFSWRLVMAPMAVIDYVVIHELAHLLEHNHSKRFWSRVAAMMPDYQQHLAWLKSNGSTLTLENLPT